MTLTRLFLICLLLPAPAAAQEATPLRWPSHTEIARIATDAAVVSQITLAAVDAWRAPDRGHAFKCLALENAIGAGATELLKRAIRRPRPDGSDHFSMPSGHTMFATLNGAPGWRYGLSVGVAYGRQAAGKHYATDVIAGAGIGYLASRVCQ